MIAGLLVIIVSLATAETLFAETLPLSVGNGDVAHLYPCESLTGEWDYVYDNYADLSLSTDHVQGSYSIQAHVTEWASYLVMGFNGATDWSDQTELHFSTNLDLVDNVELWFAINSFDDSGNSVPAHYPLSVPTANTWTDYTIDLTTPSAGAVYLNRIHYVTFFYNVQDRDATQLIDNIYTVYTGFCHLFTINSQE
jgi:hypothetical protein